MLSLPTTKGFSKIQEVVGIFFFFFFFAYFLKAAVSFTVIFM